MNDEEEIMSFAAKHNSKRNVFNLATEGYPFNTLKQMYNDPAFGPDAVYPIDGVYVFNTKYGEKPAVCCVACRCFLSLPAYQLKEVQAILADPEDINDIKSGKVGCRIVKWAGQDDTVHYKIEWVDIDLPY